MIPSINSQIRETFQDGTAEASLIKNIFPRRVVMRAWQNFIDTGWIDTGWHNSIRGQRNTQAIFNLEVFILEKVQPISPSEAVKVRDKELQKKLEFIKHLNEEIRLIYKGGKSIINVSIFSCIGPTFERVLALYKDVGWDVQWKGGHGLEDLVNIVTFTESTPKNPSNGWRVYVI